MLVFDGHVRDVGTCFAFFQEGLQSFEAQTLPLGLTEAREWGVQHKMNQMQIRFYLLAKEGYTVFSMICVEQALYPW